MPAFLNPVEAQFWVGVGLLLFLAIVIFVAKAPRTIAAALDARASTIKADLDEAARIRDEAQRLVAELHAERDAARRQAEELLLAAGEQVRMFESEAKAKLEESLIRRQRLTEQRIQAAEAQAAADVKAAAAELAAQMAEQILKRRLVGATSDPLIDKAIGQLASKL
jgi:F-type H+-transporting ATPase subunit b